MKVKHLFSGMLAMLAVLLLTGCQVNDNPVRTSLEVDTSTLTLAVGESATRTATTEAKYDYKITYSSSNPAVATVDQNGKVTGVTEGEAVITVHMDETRESWYAAKTLAYNVVVKNPSAEQLANVDKATPLTLAAQADGKITVTFNNGIILANDIHYTVNGGAEQTIVKDTKGAFDIEVKKGDVVQLYSLNPSLGGSAVAGVRGGTRAVDDGAKYINIRPSMKTEIFGNVMSLLKGKDNLESATTIEANNAFYGLFAGAEKLVNNTERLEKGCYQEMFFDCSKLNSVKCLATDISAEGCTKNWLTNAGTEATGEKVLETAVPMTSGSDDGVPDGWTSFIPVSGITLDKTELVLIVGDAAVQLKATVAPDNATDKTVTWSIDKTSVATVDATGKVTAVAEGEATITAKAGDKTATCKVTVKANVVAVTSVKLDKTELALTVGDAAVQLKATVAPDKPRVQPPSPRRPATRPPPVR